MLTQSVFFLGKHLMQYVLLMQTTTEDGENDDAGCHLHLGQSVLLFCLSLPWLTQWRNGLILRQFLHEQCGVCYGKRSGNPVCKHGQCYLVYGSKPRGRNLRNLVQRIHQLSVFSRLSTVNWPPRPHLQIPTFMRAKQELYRNFAFS